MPDAQQIGKCEIEFHKASTVWPDSVRPLASGIVTEAITGSRTRCSLEELVDGEQAGLQVQRVEGRLRQQEVDAAFDQRGDLLVVRVRPSGRT